MDFELTDSQRAIVDATRSLLTSKASMDATRRLIDSTTGFDTALWQHGVGLGWPALAIPESDGGLGQQCVELALVAVEQGRSLVSTPFIPTVVVADAVDRSGLEERSKVLQSLAEGSAVASWAFAELGQPWSAAGIRTRAHRIESGGFVLNGAKASVQDADSAQYLLVDALLDDQPARFLMPTDARGLRIEPQHTLDVTRSYCDVTFDEVPVAADALCDSGPTADSSIVRSTQLSAVLVCAELIGIGQRLQDMTVDYVKERVQFGRPVGSFQAVKHKCANMRIWVQASTAATFYAAMALDSDRHDAARAVSVAKAYVSEGLGKVAGEALQLHAGIGFTWEHDLHLYLRRARVNALLYGDAAHHRELLCQSVQSTSSTGPTA